MAGKICVAVCLVVAFICVTAEAYKCPTVPEVMCIMQGEVKCSAKKPCGKGLHCCPTICNGAECTRPEAKGRPGTCPDTTTMRLVCDDKQRAIEGKGCTRDSQCSAGRKCCDSPCEFKTECFVAEEPKGHVNHESCPAVPEILCIQQGAVTCSSDSSCSAGSHCCTTKCNGRECIRTTPAKGHVNHESCPYVIQMVCKKQGDVTCSSDSSCSAGSHCCTTQCNGRECIRTRPVDPVLVDPVPVDPVLVDPVPQPEVECPMLTAQYCEGGAVECDTDAKCGAGRKCCPAACNGRTCVGGK